MNKQHIISEIIRTAEENNGIPVGKGTFEKETGIKQNDWFGKYWAKWGDALIEAGFSPNKLTPAYDKKYLIDKFILLIKEKKKFPSKGDLRLKAHNTEDFPSDTTFNERLGTTTKRAEEILIYCDGKSGYEDVIEICRNYVSSFTKKSHIASEKEEENEIGYVYLMKHGKYYKLGRSNNAERRNYEIGIKLPEKFDLIHKITTDDPLGIEEYWHNRFKDKRKQGEWFDLSSSEIKSFKRRKFM